MLGFLMNFRKMLFFYADHVTNYNIINSSLNKPLYAKRSKKNKFNCLEGCTIERTLRVPIRNMLEDDNSEK